MVTRVASDRQGIQSIEVGFRLLNVLSGANRPMMLRDIAKGAGMPAAKAHRYMISFMRIGIVEQDSASGRYDLGSYALDIGLSGLGRLDPVRLAGPILENLCEEIQETVALAVWGNRGPTIVRIVDAGGPITITLRAGTQARSCHYASRLRDEPLLHFSARRFSSGCWMMKSGICRQVARRQSPPFVANLRRRSPKYASKEFRGQPAV